MSKSWQRVKSSTLQISDASWYVTEVPGFKMWYLVSDDHILNKLSQRIRHLSIYPYHCLVWPNATLIRHENNIIPIKIFINVYSLPNFSLQPSYVSQINWFSRSRIRSSFTVYPTDGTTKVSVSLSIKWPSIHPSVIIIITTRQVKYGRSSCVGCWRVDWISWWSCLGRWDWMIGRWRVNGWSFFFLFGD